MNSEQIIITFKNLYEETKDFNKEEFLNYYETHKKEIDEMKTRGLNVKYHINGYKIGRKQNKLILYSTNEKNNDNLETIKLDTLALNIKTINDKLDTLINMFNQFLSLLQHNQ